jgi:hypothetical protein
MSPRSLTAISVAALAGAAMWLITTGQASAFTLASPSLEQPFASSQIEKVYCRWGRCGYGYGHGYGWHGGWGPGYGYHHCWINQWGHRVCR